MTIYGKELILDLHECDPTTFTRKSLKKYFKKLCILINMKRCTMHFWDYKGYPDEYKIAPSHLKGTSAIQFISTSDIRVHTLDELKRVYLNIFTCKDFDPNDVVKFSVDWFKGKVVQKEVYNRI